MAVFGPIVEIADDRYAVGVGSPDPEPCSLFAVPFSAEDGLVGAQRFVQRVWERVHNLSEEGDQAALRRKLHQVIHKVTRSMEESEERERSMLERSMPAS